MYSDTQTRTLEPYIRTNWALAKLSALRARGQLAQTLLLQQGKGLSSWPCRKRWLQNQDITV